MKMHHPAAAAAALIALAGIAGCSSTKPEAPGASTSGFLADYTALRESDTEGFLTYSADVRMDHYDRLYLEPVIIWRGEEARKRGAPQDKVQLAADYLYTAIYQRLDRDYEMLKEFQAGALILRIAFTNPTGHDTQMDIVSTRTPQPHLIGSFREIADGVVPAVGGGILEVELRDGDSAGLILAGVEKEGDPSPTYTWGDLQADLLYDAERIGYALCRNRDKKDETCPAPRRPKNSSAPQRD